MLRPITAFWNKDYFTSKASHLIYKLFSKWAKEIDMVSKKSGTDFQTEAGFHFADDFAVGLRNLGFLEDPLFIRAIGPRKSDPVLMARIWRLWFVSWSLSQCWMNDGDILDCGTYNGKAFYSACKYASLLNNSFKINGKIVVSDLFENPPNEAKKVDHGPNLEFNVRQLFTSTFPNSKVLKGKLPEVLSQLTFEKISWCQIDLNSHIHDVNVFKTIYPYLTKGAHVIFDDYGFSRYKLTQEAVDKFLKTKNKRVFELPTGQGLFIK